jgi:CRP/FNR family transcriptional regulator, cyclic AMP receptor protein
MSFGSPFTFQFLEEFGVPLKRIRPGEHLFSAGDAGDQMFLILEGKVDVVVGEKTVSTVGLHGIVGEMALVDREPRSATAIAREAGEVAVIDRATFLELVREQPSFALYIMGVLAKRLRHMNAA